MVFQSYALFPHMTVAENIAYPLRVRGVAREERRTQAERMLSVVGLSGMGDRLPQRLSGGQQQRVALARALVFEPRALLLDEPLSALDAATRVAMRDEVRRVQRAQNIATLLITHDQDEALSLADRVVVLKDGRLVQTAAPRALYDAPADAFVASFVGRANLIDGEAIGEDTVRTAFGILSTPRHDLAPGTRMRLLVRPERIEAAPAEGAGNVFAAEVAQDRFFGASRHLDVMVGGVRLRLETLSRDEVRRVGLPRVAIQFLPDTH
jgi:putative spermidine/putrescine transport system ATP-binding protein